MPYLKKIWRFPNSIEVEKVYSGRYGRRGGHAPKSKPSPEEVQKINERNVINKLRRILKANFTEDDWHLVLTYKKDARPEPEAAKKLVDKFLRQMRNGYKKAGQSLKYILVTEYHNKAIHHHLVINNIPETIGLVKKYWTYGRPNFSPMLEEHTYGELAEYLLKETKKTFRCTPMEKTVSVKQEYDYTKTQNRSCSCERIPERPKAGKRILH